jgi:hypothetical protein
VSCPISPLAQTHINTKDLAPQAEPHKLMAVTEHRKSGLILCQRFHAEFAGPGAAVFTPVEQPYTAVIAIGSPEILAVMTYEDRQKAYSRRIQWIRWLEKIADSPNPIQRAEKLLFSFEAFFDSKVLVSLPDQVLALLAGVLPQTITAVRSQHRHMEPDDSFGAAGPRPSVCILNPQTLQPIENGAAISLTPTHGITTLCPITGRPQAWHAKVS